jgi:hypothetical protein
MATPSPSTGKLVLEPNVPQLIALKYPTGKIVESRFGEEKQVYFSLVDGRAAYFSLGLAQSINNLMLGTRERFNICKRWNGERQQAPRYDVWLTPEGEKERAAQEMQPPIVSQEPPSELEQQLDASLAAIQARKRDAQSLTSRTPVQAPPVQAPQMQRVPQGPVAVPSQARPATKLEDALKTVVSAIFAAQEYAKQIGYTAMPQFSAEDIRTMANTLIIDGQRNGAAR